MEVCLLPQRWHIFFSFFAFFEGTRRKIPLQHVKLEIYKYFIVYVSFTIKISGMSSQFTLKISTSTFYIVEGPRDFCTEVQISAQKFISQALYLWSLWIYRQPLHNVMCYHNWMNNVVWKQFHTSQLPKNFQIHLTNIHWRLSRLALTTFLILPTLNKETMLKRRGFNQGHRGRDLHCFWLESTIFLFLFPHSSSLTPSGNH